MSANEFKNKIGVELFNHNSDLINELIAKNEIDFVQITIPSIELNFETIANIYQNSNIVLHSNFLNTLGENNFDELKNVAYFIKKIKPIKVIEHFTSFRTENSKHAIHFDYNLNQDIVMENLSRWSKLIDQKVLIENIPIKRNVREYFEFIFKIVEKEEYVGFNLDLPHLLISLAYLESEDDKEYILYKLKSLIVIDGIHLGGLKFIHGELEDNHNDLRDLGLSFLLEKEIGSNYITIEQSHKVNSKELLKAISKLKNFEINKESKYFVYEKLKLQNTSGQCEIISSNVKAFEKNFGNKADVRSELIKNILGLKTINFLNKYYPFLYPVDFFNENRSLKDKVKNVLKLLLLTKDFHNSIGLDVSFRVSINSSNKNIDIINIGSYQANYLNEAKLKLNSDIELIISEDIKHAEVYNGRVKQLSN